MFFSILSCALVVNVDSKLILRSLVQPWLEGPYFDPPPKKVNEVGREEENNLFFSSL